MVESVKWYFFDGLELKNIWIIVGSFMSFNYYVIKLGECIKVKKNFKNKIAVACWVLIQKGT